MLVGYSYWGFLSDVKMNSNHEEISTPDGNAFYSWSIIKELQKDYKVFSIMPDRDKYSVEALGSLAFNAWASSKRHDAYKKMYHIEYDINLRYATKREVFEIWDRYEVNSMKFIIHEWRMEIEGRNDERSRQLEFWQPDLFLQECLLEYCKINNIKLFIFDLDYKLSEEVVKENGNIFILELGNKWKNVANAHSKKVYIPFDFDNINDFEIKSVNDRKNKLIYIGNRYERDWCIDKYIPEFISGCIVHGNWKESGRDSEKKWPKIKFEKRLQTKEMHKAYSNSICTILLAKKDYCEYNFMTARIIESIFYGSVPLFIKEYGEDTIKEYAGDFSDLLTVSDKYDVVEKIKYFEKNNEIYINVLKYIREYLSKMDCTNFVKCIKDNL